MDLRFVTTNHGFVILSEGGRCWQPESKDPFSRKAVQYRFL